MIQNVSHSLVITNILQMVKSSGMICTGKIPYIKMIILFRYYRIRIRISNMESQ